jgi:hypothetical protein
MEAAANGTCARYYPAPIGPGLANGSLCRLDVGFRQPGLGGGGGEEHEPPAHARLRGGPVERREGRAGGAAPEPHARFPDRERNASQSETARRPVGAGGFEPPTSRTRTVRSSRAEPRPGCAWIIPQARAYDVLNTRPAALACFSSTGIMKQNRLPVPSLDSHQIWPLCISTMALAMDRPRPMPPCRRVKCDSTW